MKKSFRAISLAVILGLAVSSVPAVAAPKPTLAEIEAAKKVEAAKKKAADAQAKKLAAANQSLRTLTAKANAATALYRKAQAELAVATTAANIAAKHAAETAAAVAEAHKTIGRLAANAYIMGGSLSDVQPLLSANGPQDLIDQLSTLGTLGSQNSVALDRFKVAEEEARRAKKIADDARAVQQIATQKVADAKKVADDAKAEQAKEVAKLQKVQDELMRQLMSARKVRTTLEQQRQLALLEESQASTAAQTGGQKNVWPDRGFQGRSTIRTTQAQRDKAVAFAKTQVLARKPYIWGSEGPNSFDCSGLMLAAWGAAGVSLPHQSRSQYASTSRVSRSELRPGDLVFFYSPISHVGMYIGGGLMVHAANPGDGVVVDSINGYWSGRWAGAGRV